jgi:hypothetical protein
MGFCFFLKEIKLNLQGDQISLPDSSRIERNWVLKFKEFEGRG